jgi:hypothetical protein
MPDDEATQDQELFPAATAATTAAFNSATQLFAQQLRQFSDLSLAAGTVPFTDPTGRSGTELAGELFGRLRSMAERVPAPTAQLDTFLQEIQAKRALIGALQLQLAAFEQQMVLLEQALTPLQEWGHQWAGMQRLFTEPLLSAPPDSGPAPDAAHAPDPDAVPDTDAAPGKDHR